MKPSQFKVGDRVKFTGHYEGECIGTVTKSEYKDTKLDDIRVGVHYDGESDPVKTRFDCLRHLTKLEKAMK